MIHGKFIPNRGLSGKQKLSFMLLLKIPAKINSLAINARGFFATRERNGEGKIFELSQ